MNTLIQKFNEIRDLPYHIATKGEVGYSCEEKAKMLVSEFKILGLQARVRVGLVFWSDQEWIPNNILRFAHNNECSHMFVDFLNKNGQWVFLDPTWNKELKKWGVPFSDWDGVSETQLAFKCHKILNPEESETYLANIDYAKDISQNKSFYEALNSWCDSFIKKEEK